MIKNYLGTDVELFLGMYESHDWQGKSAKNLGIYCDDADGFPFATFTVNLGEFIGLKNSAYIDTNNNPEIIEWLEKEGFGEVTGFTKRSGFCEYPLFLFKEEVLKELDAKLYETYATQFQ